MKSSFKILTALLILQVLLAYKCKKDYYSGTEFVRLNASLNNSNETINIGDTLKIRLSIPSSLTSESGQLINVNTVQHAQYTFVFYQLDTITKNVTRIRNSNSISVSKGNIDSYLASVDIQTLIAPYESVLNIVPTLKGVYYVQITNSSLLKVNNNFESFLKVNFGVSNKHWDMYNNYVPGFSSSPEIITLDNQGYGWYCFKVI